MDSIEMTHTNKSLQNSIDPFEGYASSPDRCRAHISNSKDNQQLWMQKSECIIREFIEKLPTFKNFYDAYLFLAQRRHDVAVELKQKAEMGKTEYYSLFREEGDHFRQSVSAGDGEQLWKWQKKKIFELTRELIKPFKGVGKIHLKNEHFFEDDYKICLKENVTVDGENALYYCITIKFPQNNEISNTIHADSLAVIELYEFQKNSNFDLIRIEYTPINNDHASGHYEIANHYYEKLVHWQAGNAIEIFLSNAAKLSYLMAHLLPVRQGNCAIIEWMIRAIAFNNGIEIGCFNHSEGISWDFKAMLTPNQDDYIKWYSEKLFLTWSLFDKNTNTKLFSFPSK